MRCPECVAEVLADSHFCPKCGSRLGDAPAAGEGPAPRERFTEAARSRAESTADEEEHELWSGGYSAKAMIGWWIGALVLTVILIIAAIFIPPAMLFLLPVIPIVWIIPACMVQYRKLNVHYLLTSQRFIHKTGVLSRTTDRIEVIDMDDVTYRQGLVERFLGVGTIRITGSDRTHPELVLLGIDDVARVADLIDDTRRKERRRRGLHIEAI